MREHIEERVCAAIGDCFDTDKPLAPTDSLIDDLHMDSLDLVECVMSLEEEFGFEVDEQEALRWLTVKDVVDWVAERYEP